LPPWPPQRVSPSVVVLNAWDGPRAASDRVHWTQRAQQGVPVPPPPVQVAKRIVPTPPPPPLRYMDCAADVGNHVDMVHNDNVAKVFGGPVNAGVILSRDRVEVSVAPVGGACPGAAVTAVASSVGPCALHEVATPPQYTHAAPGRAVCGRVGTVSDHQVASGVASLVLCTADLHQQHAAVSTGRPCSPSVASDVARVTAPAGSVPSVVVPSSSLRADVVVVPRPPSPPVWLVGGAHQSQQGAHQGADVLAAASDPPVAVCAIDPALLCDLARAAPTMAVCGRGGSAGCSGNGRVMSPGGLVLGQQINVASSPSRWGCGPHSHISSC
jgi:hypothetical protein